MTPVPHTACVTAYIAQFLRRTNVFRTLRKAAEAYSVIYYSRYATVDSTNVPSSYLNEGQCSKMCTQNVDNVFKYLVSLVPRAPHVFCSSVCVRYNTRKSGEKRFFRRSSTSVRPGNEASISSPSLVSAPCRFADTLLNQLPAKAF